MKWLFTDGLLTHYLCALLFHFLFFSHLLALPTKARIGIVFRFIIEYNSLRDFYRPLVINRSIFYTRIFER